MEEYIVLFNEFIWTKYHPEYIEKIFGTRNGYKIIERNNPSTQRFPSDFALLRVCNVSLLMERFLMIL